MKNIGSSSFSMDKMIFNSRPRWFLWGHPHKTTKSRIFNQEARLVTDRNKASEYSKKMGVQILKR